MLTKEETVLESTIFVRGVLIKLDPLWDLKNDFNLKRVVKILLPKRKS